MRPDVIFVTRHVNWGTAITRGVQIGQAWSPRTWRLVACDTDAAVAHLRRAFSVKSDDALRNATAGTLFIHIKYACRQALDVASRAAHAYDPLDSNAGPLLRALGDRGYQAIIAHNRAHFQLLGRHARAPVVVIPHHALPHCAARPAMRDPHAARRVLVLGLDPPNAALSAALRAWEASRRGQVDLVFERDERLRELRAADSRAGPQELRVSSDPNGAAWASSLCSLMRSADMAVAWDQISNSSYLRECERVLKPQPPNACFAGKPAERLLNPLAVGVPTIGFAGYPSFQEVGLGRRAMLSATADATTAPGSLLSSSVSDLTAQLDRWLLDETAWLRAQAAALATARPHAVSRIVPRFYEALFLRMTHRSQRPVDFLNSDVVE